MKIKSGKSRILLDDSKSAAIRAIRTYSDVDDKFRVQTYITLMNMAYTKLFLSFFYKTIGDRYYYKDGQGRYEIKKGQKMVWDLSKCIKEFNKIAISKSDTKVISNDIIANIEFFIGIRNEIEHYYMEESELEKNIFGELQAYIYNYNFLLDNIFSENIKKYLRMPLLLDFFQEDYSSIVNMAGNRIIKYIEKYKQNLALDIQNSDKFSFKFIAMPNTSNKSSAPAITFIRENELNNEVVVAIREKTVEKNVTNLGLYRPTVIVDDVLKNNELKYGSEYTKNNAATIFTVLNIRDLKTKCTNDKYCYYDQLNEVFGYKEDTKKLLIEFFNNVPKEEMLNHFREKTKIELTV